MKNKKQNFYPSAEYPFEIRYGRKGVARYSSGWNRDDTKDVVKLVIVALVVVVSATLFGYLN